MTTPAAEPVTIIDQSIGIVFDYLKRIDNGETLRQWEVMDAIAAVDNADAALSTITEPEGCNEPHCLYEHVPGTYPPAAGFICDSVITYLTHKVEELEDELFESKEALGHAEDRAKALTARLATMPETQPVAHSSRLTLAEEADLLADVLTTGAENDTLRAENAALREMVALLQEQNAILRANVTKALKRKIA